MAEHNYNRILISSGLQKIEKREKVEESVRTIDDVLRLLAQNADQTLRQMKMREGSRFLEENLDLLDLKTVGLYHTQRRVERERKIISFQREHIAIEFYYNKLSTPNKKAAVEEVVEDESYFSGGLVLLSRRLPPEVMAQQIQAIGSQMQHSENISVKRKERSMGAYVLDRVDVVSSVAYQFFGVELPFFDKKKRETVYSVLL